MFRWPTLRLNGYPETTSYNYMMSSNHKVLPLGKHKLGIAGNQELLGIGNCWESGNAGNPRQSGIQGNRGSRAIGNIWECPGEWAMHRQSGIQGMQGNACVWEYRECRQSGECTGNRQSPGNPGIPLCVGNPAIRE